MRKPKTTAADTRAAAVYADPSSLIPWPKNPRLNDPVVPGIAKSIQTYGFGAPVVARAKNRMIIAGHTRWKAALSLKLDEIPVRFLDLSEKEAEALAIADNRLGEEAVWDEVGLRQVLLALQASNEIDLTSIGFNDDQLADILRESLLIPDGEPQAEPNLLSECMVEIRCSRETLEALRGTLMEWTKHGATVNVS